MPDRRVFLCALGSALWVRGGSPPGAAEEFELPERQLLGLERPELRGEGFNLLKPAAEAFGAMRADAKKDGIEMYSQSSHRGFDHQLRIWNRKYKQFSGRGANARAVVERIVEYSSVPGTSRHHWGTDLDIIDLAPPRPADVLSAKHYRKDGAFAGLYQWLIERAASYGFYETYTDDPSRPGFHYEPWHWSYAPLSVPLLRQFHQIDLPRSLPLSRYSGKEALTAGFFDRYRREWGLGIQDVLVPGNLGPAGAKP